MANQTVVSPSLSLSIILRKDPKKNGILRLHEVNTEALKNLPLGKVFEPLFLDNRNITVLSLRDSDCKYLPSSDPYWENVDYFDTMRIIGRDQTFVKVEVVGFSKVFDERADVNVFQKSYRKTFTIKF